MPELEDEALAVPSTERPTVDAARPKGDASVKTRYVRRGLIGRGGLGEVWLAHDRVLDRYVALKIANEGANAEGRARFEEEARLQAALEHPGIAPVYDVGVDEDGRPYFVMQRIAGEPLSEILRRRLREPEIASAWPRGRLLRLFIELCRSIEYAQSRNVVHCDLKPENVIVGRLGEPYVIDWGISRRMRRREGEAERDAVLGSPGYMAPEQLEGRKHVSPRSDVYSLGCILFEMLAGRPIVATDDGIAVWAARVLSGLDARPSVHVGEDHVPPELDAICVRATALDPEARYRSVAALAQDVEAFENGDRDKILRATLAEASIASARARLETAPEDAVALGLAMQDVGRALAFAPESEEARALAERIFASEPRSMPESLRSIREADDARRVQEYARSEIGAYGAMLVLLAAGVVLSVAPFELLIVPLVWYVVMLAVGTWIARAKSPPPSRFFLWSLGDAALVLYSGAFIGPFLALPTVMTLHVMLAMHLPRAAQRRAVLAAHALAFVVPMALELASVTDYVHIVDGSIATRLRWVPAPSEDVVTSLLVLFHALVLGTAIIVTTTLSSSRSRVFARQEWQRWLLGRLLGPPGR